MCPLFGAEIAPGNSDFTVVAAVIGKDSGVGIGCPAAAAREVPAKPPKTAQERIAALRKAGVDVSHLFAMQGANGGEFVASNKDGRLAILEDNDPIFDFIAGQGTVPNRSLFRRWVMGQMFHMMSYVPYGQREPLGVTEMIHRLGYEYQWKMLINELNAQMKMEGKDSANFADRNRWFHTGMVIAMAQDYIAQLKEYVAELPVKRCKGIPYKRISGDNIFVSDIQFKLYNPLVTAIRRIESAKNAVQLYNAAKTFNELRVKLAWDTTQSKAWIDAYKGSGAFFTMQNLIRFHNCVIIDDRGNRLVDYRALAFLSAKAEQYKNGEGWRMLAALKKMLDDNGIDVREKVAEWRRRK